MISKTYLKRIRPFQGHTRYIRVEWRGIYRE